MAKKTLEERFERAMSSNLGINYKPYATDDGPRGVGITTYKPTAADRTRLKAQKNLAQAQRANAVTQSLLPGAGQSLFSKDAQTERDLVNKGLGRTTGRMAVEQVGNILEENGLYNRQTGQTADLSELSGEEQNAFRQSVQQEAMRRARDSISAQTIRNASEEVSQRLGSAERSVENLSRRARSDSGASAALQAAKTERNAMEQRQNELAAQYYNAENRESAGRIQNDEQAKKLYDDLAQLDKDLEQLPVLQQMRSGGAGTPVSDAELQRMAQAYGFTTEELQYNYGGVLAELQRRREQTVQQLADAGYDYERMAEYAERQTSAERNQRNTERWAQEAKEHPVASSLASIATSAASGADFFDMVLENIGHNDVTDLERYQPYDTSGMTNTNYTQTVRGAVSEDMSPVASFLYNTGLSLGESVALAATLGPAAAPVMGLSAAANGMKSAVEAGANNKQALTIALAAGAAEMVFEKLSLDELLKPTTARTGKELILQILKQSGVEASEEMMTEAANILADVAILRGNGQMEQAYQTYLQSGMDAKEAGKRVVQDMVQQVGLAGLGGAISGGVSGGIFNAAGYLRNREQSSNEILRSAQDDTRKPASVAEMAADMLDAPKAQQTEQAAPYAPENPTVAEIAAGYEPAPAAQQELDTTIDADPTTHTPEQMQSIREYQRATDSGLLRFIDKVKSLTDKSYQAKIKYSLGDTSARQAADVKKNTGVNADGFTNKISGTSVMHIINRHGENGEADSSMAKPQDIARIGYVLNHYDSAQLLTDENGKQVFSTEWTNSNGSPAQMMVFSKKIDGTYYVIEAAPDSKRKNLMVVSAYIQKNNGNAAHTLNMEDSSPQLTSQTPYESRASVKTSVPQSGGAVKAEDSVGAAKYGFDQYSHAQLEYGTIPEGENPARTVDVPKQMDDGSYVGRGTRTIMEAGATSELLLPQLEQGVVQGMFSHKVQKNKDILSKASGWVAQVGGGNLNTAFSQWYRDTGKQGALTNDQFARGMVIYDQLNRAATLAQQNGNEAAMQQLVEQAVQTAVVLEGNAHTVAQQMQMMRMLKRLSPDMQIMALEKTVQELNAKLLDRNKAAIDMNDPELQSYKQQWREALAAGNETAAQAAKDAMYRAIAAKVPKTFGECFNAWRYLAMLGNPKTIVRNTLGNVAMMPMTGVKNAIGAGLEKVAVKKEDRTKVAIPLRTSERGQKLLAFAKEDFDTVRQTALGENKNASSNTGSELQKAIREAHSKFNANGVKQWQQATDWAMNNELFGDVGFLKRHYQHALAQAAMARGYTAQQMRDGKIDEAAMDKLRAYAVKQAQEATFRDTNSLTKLVKKLDFTPTTAAGKAAKFAIEGTLPFKSTPANVLARGLEYGPGGVLRALSTDLHKVATGKISAADYVENLSKGLAGTAVLGLGYVLAANGLLTGGEIDDDDEREGHQAYALELNGKSYTMDWLSPVAIPLFMGVELQRMTQDDGQDAFGAFVDASSNLMAPLLELSCMSGMKDMLDQIAYGTDGADLGNMVYAFFVQPFLSYVGQAVPTLLSQLATTMETERGYTYVGDINNNFRKNVTRSAARITEKIPGVDWRQQPYVDEFGRKETYDTSFGGYAARAVENFVSPGYLSDIEQTDTDRTIREVEEASGEEVSPTRRGYTIDLGDETVRLTGDQHTQYQTTYGETVTALYDAAERSAGFRLLSPEEQAAVLDTAREYANAVGKAAVTEYETDAAWMRNLMAQDAPAEDVAQYVINKQVGSAFSEAMKLAETDAAAGAAEIDRIFNAYEGLDEAQQVQLLEQVGGQLESYVAMRRAGLDAAQYVQVRGAYDAIEAQEDAGAVQKATEFAKWLDESGLNGRQKRVAKEQMKYWQIFPAEAERYETLTGAGMSADKSKAVYDAMAAREADTNAKKYDAINAAQGLSNEDKYLAARALLAGDDDTANARIDAAMMAGIDYGTWTKYYNAKEYYKEELGISVNSKAEYTELINGLGIQDTTTKQALWVIANLNHKPWTCPYGSSELSRELYYYLQEHKTVSEYE